MSSISRLVAVGICVILLLVNNNAIAFISSTSSIFSTTPLPSLSPMSIQSRYCYPPRALSKSDTDDTIENIDIDIDIDSSSDALVPDIAYYYLRNTIGLSEETMWKITLEAGSLLGMTPRNLEKKISLLRRTMDLSEEDIREMLGKQPAVLHYSADRNLAPTILLLVRALDLSKSELRSIIMACPSILGYSFDNLKRKLSFYMDTLGYNTEKDGKGKLRRLIVSEPKLLSSGVESGLVPRMKFLHREIQFTLKDLRKLYQQNPKLLLYSLDGNLRPKIVFFFILQLQMEPEHVRKMIMSYPKVLDYNLENHMKPIAEYFATELEFSSIEMRSIILRFPRLFTHSLFKIKHVVGFLRYELALDAQQVKRVIFQAPQVIGLDTEGNMKEKLDFLQQRVDLTQNELASVVAKMPTVFCLGVESSLIPKFEYFESCLNTTAGVKEVLLKQPALLGYSLSKRIQPRMEQLIKAGIDPRKITVAIPMTEDRFNLWLLSSESKLKASPSDSTIADYVSNHLDFTDSEIDACSQLQRLPKASIKQISSHVSYLKEVFGDSNLKNLILECPALMDLSRKRQLRRRISDMLLVGLPLQDNVQTLNWDNDAFNTWISPMIKEAQSDIKFLTTKLGLNSNENQTLLSVLPDLELTYDRKGRLRSKVEYLITRINDQEKVKCLLLNQPEILDLRPTRVKYRLDKMMLTNVSDTDKMGDLLVMSNHMFQNWWAPIQKEQACNDLTSLYGDCIELLESTLDLRQNEVESLLINIPEDSLSTGNAVDAAEYFVQAFNNSTAAAKKTIIKRPSLLSFTTNELQNRTRHRMDRSRSIGMMSPDKDLILATTDEMFESQINYWNASQHMLSEVLSLDREDCLSILSSSKNRLLKDPQQFLLPKLRYLLSMFHGCTENVASCFRDNPDLIHDSFERKIKPRMKILAGTNISVGDVTNVMTLTNNEVDQRKRIQQQYNLSNHELERIVPLKKWLKQTRFRRIIEPNLGYLSSLLNSLDFKKVVLKNPSILRSPITTQMNQLIEWQIKNDAQHSKIVSILSLPPKKAEKYMLGRYLSNELDFTEKEADKLINAVSANGQSLNQPIQKIGYLLSEAFHNSTDDLKKALLSNPTILRKSLTRTISPRVETQNYLKLLDLESTPGDMGGILVQTANEYEKTLVPFMNTWGAPAIEMKEEFNEDDVFAALQEFAPSIVFAYSDDFNREIEKIVHWR